MNQGLKRLLIWVLAFGLFLHFFLIIIYSSTLVNGEGKLKALSRMYVYPVFHQNWCLFVPPPTVKNSIYVRYKTADGYTNWTDILLNEINKHKANRLIGHESVCLLFSNSLVYELIDLSEHKTKVYFKKPENIAFDVLHFEISQYLKVNNAVKSQTPCEYLLVSSSPKNTSAYYFKELKTK